MKNYKKHFKIQNNIIKQQFYEYLAILMQISSIILQIAYVLKYIKQIETQ